MTIIIRPVRVPHVAISVAKRPPIGSTSVTRLAESVASPAILKDGAVPRRGYRAVPEKRNVVCYNCRKTGEHMALECKEACSYCLQPDHSSYSCPDRKAGRPRVLPEQPTPWELLSSCYNCGDLGHYSMRCRQKCKLCSAPGHNSYYCPLRLIPPSSVKKELDGAIEVPKIEGAPKRPSTLRLMPPSSVKKVFKGASIPSEEEESDEDEVLLIAEPPKKATKRRKRRVILDASPEPAVASKVEGASILSEEEGSEEEEVFLIRG